MGTVTFALNFVRSAEISGSVKEADARVAFEALQHLGYMEGATFEVHNRKYFLFSFPFVSAL